MTRANWQWLESFAFGDSPELADELAALVLDGPKRAERLGRHDGPLLVSSNRDVVASTVL